MEGNGGEVTQKIRALITKKLVELGVYVDEELPDYIMVMVANKKSRVHMSDDLMLFLGTHTEHFTRWLNGILESLPSSLERKVSTLDEKESPSEQQKNVETVLCGYRRDDEEAFAFKEDVTDDFLADELKTEESAAKETLPAIKKTEDSARVSAKVRPMMQRISTHSLDVDDEEYDPRNPAVGSVASVVRLTERKWRLPPSLQANKLLLLKAVDAANKSCKTAAPYRPTPIPPKEDTREDTVVFEEEEEPDLRLLLKSHVALRGIKRKNPECDCREEGEAPKFVVTLDGVDPSKFASAKVARLLFPPEDSAESEGDARVSERCRYWPACRNGDACSRLHPMLSCRSFPGCKFGDKCLYIHPNCRFDACCTRTDCPYTHASKRPSPGPAMSNRKKTTPCKFLPNCTKSACPYLHPKVCRFGDRCHTPECSFAHPLPSRERLKWVASPV